MILYILYPLLGNINPGSNYAANYLTFFLQALICHFIVVVHAVHNDTNPRNYEEIQLGDDNLNTVKTFKYLGSIFDSNGGAERDINNRVKLAWMKWKQLTGVLCDKKVPIKLKDKCV